VTQELWHNELMGGEITDATDETAPGTASRTAVSIGPLVSDPTAVAPAAAAASVAEVLAMSALPVIGVIDAATARTAHVRLNASAIAAHRPARDTRAILTATGVDTRER